MSIGQARYDFESASDYFAAKRSRYAQALSSGDAEGTMAIIDELVATKQSLGDIYTQVIGPSLTSLGEAWCRGETSIGEEKLASQFVIGHMDRLRALYAPPWAVPHFSS